MKPTSCAAVWKLSTTTWSKTQVFCSLLRCKKLAAECSPLANAPGTPVQQQRRRQLPKRITTLDVRNRHQRPPLMTIVKQILGHHVTFGGESHSGWLPENAAVPKPTPTQDVALDITIESSGDGYLLCWSSPDNPFGSDL